VGGVYKSTYDESPLQGFNRVLQFINDENEVNVVLINIPTEPVKNEGAKQKNYYVKGFFMQSLKELTLLEEQKLIKESSVKYSAIWDMSDEEIRKDYPPKNGQTECYQLASRDRKFLFIQPIIDYLERTPGTSLMELGDKIEMRAKIVKASKGQLLDALHRYFAYGCITNALIPNMSACGDPGADRISKKVGVKLGCRNAAAKVGNIELQGKILDSDDHLNLRNGWEMYVRPGTSIPQAFLAMSSTFYNSGHELKHGKYLITLLPAHLRPTEYEFRYHGPKASSELSAVRRLMGEGEWLKNCRSLTGSAQTGVLAIGQVGSIDASPIDVNEVSCFDPLLPIGVGRAIVVTDVDSGLIMGWHVAIGGIGTEDANLAILCAAQDKSELLKRYGLDDLPVADFPAMFFGSYLADNGELRSIAGIDAVVRKLGSKLRFIPSRRADYNSVSESGHHSRNKGLNHYIEGTTKGRQKRRGEPLPITKAVLSHYQYMRLLIKWIHWRNTKQEVRKLLTTEMLRDKVEPTRIAIYRWAKTKGYVGGLIRDINHLRAHLLPTFKASIQRTGLILHRPKNGNKIELLPDARFTGDYLITSGLIRSMQNGGQKYVDIKANPDDLSEIYLFDKNGVHVLKNVSNDVILLHEGCVADLCAKNDTNRQQEVESKTQSDQNMNDVNSLRIEEVAEAKRLKKAAQLKAKGNPKPETDGQSVRANQEKERRAQLDAAVKRASSPNTDTKTVIQKVDEGTPKSALKQSNTDKQEKKSMVSIQAIREAKLRKFHNDQGAVK
jgi:hypothetical protein